MVAMHCDYILLPLWCIKSKNTCEEVGDFLAEFKHCGDGWRLVIGPEKLHYLVIKLFVVIFSVAGVYYKVVLFTMFEFHEACDVVDGVAVGLLQA